MDVQEVFSPKHVTASGAVLASGGKIGGFLCTTSGNVKLSEGVTGAGTTYVDTFAVTAGVFYPMPFAFAPATIVYATLSGGAAGTFAVLGG